MLILGVVLLLFSAMVSQATGLAKICILLVLVLRQTQLQKVLIQRLNLVSVQSVTLDEKIRVIWMLFRFAASNVRYVINWLINGVSDVCRLILQILQFELKILRRNVLCLCFGAFISIWRLNLFCIAYHLKILL